MWNWILFLQGAAVNNSDRPSIETVIAIVLSVLIFLILLGIALYIYTSLVFMAIGKRAKVESYGVAWIPIIGPSLISYRASKMHYWPWLLLLSLFLTPLMILSPILAIISTLIITICILTFMIYTYVWQWRMFEEVGREGWWVLTSLIPIAGFIIYLVLLGIAAWGKTDNKKEDDIPNLM
jgi:hypothetical protein